MAYKKEDNISYSLGSFATMELLKYRKNAVKKIYLHKDIKQSADIDELLAIAKSANIPCEQNSHKIENISKKENVYCMGEFEKYEDTLGDGNQIVLHNPSDMGNLGTIFRTALGFGFKNIVLISPCADRFNPKAVRASMGAVFGLNVVEFSSFEEYAEKYKDIKKYLFMLDGNTILQDLEPKNEKIALVFGNEATGLPQNVKKFGEPVFIKHTNAIDSLNLAISASIAMFKFSK